MCLEGSWAVQQEPVHRADLAAMDGGRAECGPLLHPQALAGCGVCCHGWLMAAYWSVLLLGMPCRPRVQAAAGSGPGCSCRCLAAAVALAYALVAVYPVSEGCGSQMLARVRRDRPDVPAPACAFSASQAGLRGRPLLPAGAHQMHMRLGGRLCCPGRLAFGEKSADVNVRDVLPDSLPSLGSTVRAILVLIVHLCQRGGSREGHLDRKCQRPPSSLFSLPAA